MGAGGKGAKIREGGEQAAKRIVALSAKEEKEQSVREATKGWRKERVREKEEKRFRGNRDSLSFSFSPGCEISRNIYIRFRALRARLNALPSLRITRHTSQIGRAHV